MFDVIRKRFRKRQDYPIFSIFLLFFFSGDISVKESGGSTKASPLGDDFLVAGFFSDISGAFNRVYQTYLMAGSNGRERSRPEESASHPPSGCLKREWPK